MTVDFNNYVIYSYKSQLIELNTNINEKEYLHIFEGQLKDNFYFTKFYFVLNKYYFYDNILNNTKITQIEQINNVFCARVVSSYKTDKNEIILFYYNKNYKIIVYDNDLNKKFEETISEIGNINGDTGVFLKCIYLKNNLGVFIYYKDEGDFGPPHIKIENIENINEEMLWKKNLIFH